MRFQALIPIIAGTILAGCDDSQPTQPKQPIVVRSQAQDHLHQLDDMRRAIALRRAIFASGSRCQRVTESGYVEEYGNLSMWTASCDDGRSWAIFIAPDSTVQVRRCESLADLGLPACKIKESAKPATAEGDDEAIAANSVR